MFCKRFYVLFGAIVSLELLVMAPSALAEGPDGVPRIFAQATLGRSRSWRDDDGAKLLVSLQRPDDPNVVVARQRIDFADVDHAPLGIMHWKAVDLFLAHEGGTGNLGAWFVPADDDFPPLGAIALAGPGGDVVEAEEFFIRLVESSDNLPGAGHAFLTVNGPDTAYDLSFQVGVAAFSK